MKKPIITLFLLLINLGLSHAQKLTFDYDSAGNQISRIHVCVNCPQSNKTSLSEDAKSIDAGTGELSMIDIGSGSSLTVNTEKQKINFHPPRNEKSALINIIIRNADNQTVFSSHVTEYSEPLEIDVSTFIAGKYLLFLNWTNGTKKVIELSKV